MKNLAIKYLRETNRCLEDYDGSCGELVDDLMHWLGEERVSILSITPRFSDGCISAGPHEWRYHMAPVIDGVVHDAWFPDELLEPAEYTARVFAGQDIKCTITGQDEPLPADVAFKV